MKSRRGSTRSPIRVEKVSSAEVGVADPDLQQRADFGVERRLPQLLRVHLAEALVAVDLDAAAAEFHDRLDQADGAGDRVVLVARDELAGRVIDLAQPCAVGIEPARLARLRSNAASISRRSSTPWRVRLKTRPSPAMTSPCQLRSCSGAEQVEPLGGAVRGLDRAVRVGEQSGRQAPRRSPPARRPRRCRPWPPSGCSQRRCTRACSNRSRRSLPAR